MSNELDPNEEAEKAEEQKKADRVAAMNRGRERKRRKELLEEKKIPFTEDWLEENLDSMEKEEFNEYVEKYNPSSPKKEENAAGPKTEEVGDKERIKSERELELERELADMKRKFEVQEKTQITQADVDAIIEKKMLEIGLRKGEEMTGKQNMDVLSKMSEAIEQMVQSNNDGRVIVQPVTRQEIDHDDILDEPAFFFTFTQNNAIWGDTRNGQSILNPHRRPIKFEHEFRTTRPGRGREKEVIAISKAKIISKKELEYMRSHSGFNNWFFEDLGKATAADARIADIRMMVHGSVSSMNDYQVIEKCRLMNPPIPIDTDVSMMRRVLVNRLADDQMRNIQAQRNQPLSHHPTATLEQEGAVRTAEGVI